jgi:hypothetical protein
MSDKTKFWILLVLLILSLALVWLVNSSFSHELTSQFTS